MVNRLSGNTRLLASDASAVVMVVRIEYKKKQKTNNDSMGELEGKEE